MSFAESFRALDFLEQAQALHKLQTEPSGEALAALMPLFQEPTGDTAADTMVRNSIRTLLQKAPESIISGLEHPHLPFAALCRDLAGEMQLDEAAPVLVNQLSKTSDSASLHETLTALGRIGALEAIPVFRDHMRNADPVVSSLCIQYLGMLGDTGSIPALSDIVAANETEERYAVCDITTWAAIEGLGRIGASAHAPALSELARFIHHRNPEARRIVQETFVQCGVTAIPHVSPALLDSDKDCRIMAANALRDIAHKASAEPLINALEQGAASDPNVGFAIYEALGRTPGVKSLVALTDALPIEQEPTTLLAVVHALESLTSAVVGKRFLEIITDRMAARDQQAQRILQAVMEAHAVKLFPHLYADPVAGRILVSLILKSKNTETMQVFLDALAQCQGELARKDEAAIRMGMPRDEADRPKLLAIDDSTAMRNFYRTHGAIIGFDVTLAEHGRDALDIVEALNGTFDVIVVDMNMPVMDGIQFTEKLRAMPLYATTPVLMATTESGRSQATLARKSGVSSFLPKPFTPEMLQNRLGKLLERAKR
ncbi:HEAT repeat domain-containing protein [Desulfovibrio mangrovi]|uniref:response regulator n=1 Tax=Desulfovibrio mangrovi TaxID=2976983 RepID=UPI002247B800|nr:HEAT repeat domain-containing protein [Desulfovibrio mangrovi]UZP66807.1 HEAT repeat domain-containing protein [Desulfovibrio mangrovi]